MPSKLTSIAVDEELLTAWTDYSAISTIVGWSAFTVKEIWYKKFGSLVFCEFDIQGTSDDTVATFTLPYAHNSDLDMHASLGRFMDNTVWLDTAGFIFMSAGSSIVSLGQDGASTAWTNSGVKRVKSQFFFQTT